MSVDLINQLKRHEGYRQFPYRCTAGKLTVGFGRNLDDVGITKGEAETLLWLDVAKVRNELEEKLPPWWSALDEVRQEVLINMGFNLGVNGLLKFKKMLSAVERKDYIKASKEMIASKWSKQVGTRADELAQQMLTGERWING